MRPLAFAFAFAFALALALAVAGCSTGGGGSGGSRGGRHGGGSASGGAAASSPAPASAPAPASLVPALAADPARACLRDALGREVLLRGANYSGRAKTPPFADWQSEAHLDLMGPRWGMSSIRLLLVWEAVEPQPGQYDDAYLDSVARVLEWCEARGMYAVIDMHQDMWSRRFGGDGAPAWADVDSLLVPNTPVGFPLNYLNPDVAASFDRFYRDPAIRDAFVAMWAHVASRLAPYAAVAGYDILNEPWPGSLGADAFERGPLSDLYEAVAAAIRAADPTRPILVEPQTLAIAGLATHVRPPAFGNVVYAPHFYDPIVEMRSALGLDPAYDGDASRTEAAFALARTEAARLGAAPLVGELGIPLDRTGALAYLLDHYRLLDEQRLSAWMWNFDPGVAWSPVDAALTEKPEAVAAIARPYPAATAGLLRSFRFDPASRVFEMTWDEASPRPAGPTVVPLAAAIQYPGGFRVTSTDAAGTWSWRHDQALGRLEVEADPAAPTHTLRVEPN